ncbi:GPR72 [Mytilus edulis]|uniref:GPR83 n=1 Tax=Mytilus edulis TaxID=6550 RepID=A0A8S3VGG2_MYTED|nr:GPR72 [Mytilus edulis]
MTNVITQIENLFKNINGTNKTDSEDILKQNNTLDDPVQFDINRAIVLIPSFGILAIITIFANYFIPLIVITCTYGRIVHKLWIRTHLGVVTENQRLMQIQAKRKSIKLLVAVVAVFAISWMPLNLYYILADHHPNTKVFHPDTNTFFVCHWIAISSSCINPFLYCWMNPAFSTVIAKRLRCLKSFTGGPEIEIDEIDSTGFRLRSNRRFGNSSRTISSFSASDSRRSSSKTFRGFAYMV